MKNSVLYEALARLGQIRARLLGVTLGVRAIVRDGDGQILLVKHSYGKGWHFPGGGVKPGENVFSAIRREIDEEAGIVTCDNPNLVGVFYNSTWSKGDHVLLFEVRNWCQRPWRAGGEIVAAQFFPVTQLPNDASLSIAARLSEIYGASASLDWLTKVSTIG